MGELDTDHVWEVPKLSRLYAKEAGGDRELDLMVNGGGKYADRLDALVNPGMLPFPCRLFAEWHTADHPDGVTTEWPNLPDGMVWETFALTDEDRGFLRKHPECVSVYLLDVVDCDCVHVFYDAIEGIWNPVYEGPADRTHFIKAYWNAPEWLSANWMDEGEYDWPEVPAWARKKGEK